MDRAARIEYLAAMGVDVWTLRGAEPVTEPERAAPEVPRDPPGPELDARSPSNDPAAPPAVPEPAAPARGLVVGPGNGKLLLLCERPEDAARTVATDIARCLDGAPVWAWPAPPGSADAPALEDAIRDRLFTGVLVFGQRAAGLAGGAGDPVRGSARIVFAPPLSELEARPDARRALWQRLRETDWCVRRVSSVNSP